MPTRRVTAFVAGFALTSALVAWAATPVAAPPSTASQPILNSELDAPLFYELLVGEIALRQGEIGAGFQQLLSAARRSRNEALFRRAVEVAIEARAPEQALTAAKAWRSAVPKSREALEFVARLQLIQRRESEAVAPLREWLALAPQAARVEALNGLPRMFSNMTDRRVASGYIDELTQPFVAATQPGVVRSAAWVARGRAALRLNDSAGALRAAREGQSAESSSLGVALLAVELMPKTIEAEPLVRRHVAQRPDSPARLPFIQALIESQRLSEAVVQLESLTQARPSFAPAWLTLGALQVDLRQSLPADTSLKKYLDLAKSDVSVGPDVDPVAAQRGLDQGRTQAYLLLAQAAELRSDFKSAEMWLGRVDDPKQALAVQSRRALLLAKQGKVSEARSLLHKVPERQPEDARAKVLAEVQLLRDVRQYREAYKALDEILKSSPQDIELLYEKAMVVDRMGRAEEMERLLRQVIGLKPDFFHAYNALGYSLADRGERLDEARALVAKALSLSPTDPFITDSMGWVEFRAGRLAEALKYLRQAWSARQDTEIGAHFGEVLWTSGDKEEALRIWRQARERDADNEVLRETLSRLRVAL